MRDPYSILDFLFLNYATESGLEEDRSQFFSTVRSSVFSIVLPVTGDWKPVS